MSERGSVLVLALCAVSIFSIVTASLAIHAGQEVLLMKRELSGLRSRADFASGIAYAAGLIQEDPVPHEDSKDKPWFGDIELEGPLGKRLSARLEDEESKLNLNHASAAFLNAFLKDFEDEVAPLKGERKDYVKAVLKLRFEKRIESLEELLLTEDFEKEDFEVLKPYLTVYPELPHVNVNTASPLVLKALIESLGGDHGTKLMLAGRLEEACGDRCFFLNSEMNPESFSEKLKLPKTPLMMQAVQQLLAGLTTDSETFRIVMRSSGAESAGVFKCRVGQVRPEVLWWHEDL